MNSEIEKNIEVKGESFKVTATPQQEGNYQYNMGKDNFTYANRSTKGKVRTFKPDRFNVIGRRDAGFSQVAILSVVIAIAVLVIAYFAFRF